MKTKEYVKEVYGKIAKGQEGCGCGCGPGAGDIARSIGYSKEELSATPGSNDPLDRTAKEEGGTIADRIVSVNLVGRK